MVLWLHVAPDIGGLISESDRDLAVRSGDWKDIQNKSRSICIVLKSVLVIANNCLSIVLSRENSLAVPRISNP